MSITLEKMKRDQLHARKNKNGMFNEVRVKILTTIIGEVSQMKNPTEDDVLKILTKAKKNIEFTLKNQYSEAVHTELCIVSSYLPEVLDRHECRLLLSQSNYKNVGQFMGAMQRYAKENDLMFDGAEAKAAWEEVSKGVVV